MKTRVLLMACCFVAYLSTPATAQDASVSTEAQDVSVPSEPRQAQQQTAPTDTVVVELVLRREVFSYPTFTRQNPFVPLTSTEAGPRFDQMQLTGILEDELDPARSIAVIAAVGFGQQDQPGGGGSIGAVERLRIGDRWGNVRVVSIEPARVVVDVNNFGIVERREMRLQSRSQGGS